MEATTIKETESVSIGCHKYHKSQLDKQDNLLQKMKRRFNPATIPVIYSITDTLLSEH